jgi:hypothetical protein
MPMNEEAKQAIKSPEPTWRMLPADPNSTRLHQNLRAAEARQRAAENRATEIVKQVSGLEQTIAELNTQLEHVTKEYTAIKESAAYRWGMRLVNLKSTLTGKRRRGNR